MRSDEVRSCVLTSSAFTSLPMKPYSLDLRQKIIDAYTNAEGSIRKLAQRFKVSPDFVRRLVTRHKREGTIAPKPHGGGHQPKLTSSGLDILQALLEEDNDATLEQLAQRLEQRTQVVVSTSTISRALRKLGITRKKKALNPVKPTKRSINVRESTTGTLLKISNPKI